MRDYAITPDDFTVLVYANTGPVRISLPLATGSGQLFHVKDIGNSDEIVTIAAQGTDLIDGSIAVNFMSQWAGAVLQDASPGYWDNIGSITGVDGI